MNNMSLTKLKSDILKYVVLCLIFAIIFFISITLGTETQDQNMIIVVSGMLRLSFAVLSAIFLGIVFYDTLWYFKKKRTRLKYLSEKLFPNYEHDEPSDNQSDRTKRYKIGVVIGFILFLSGSFAIYLGFPPIFGSLWTIGLFITLYSFIEWNFGTCLRNSIS